ncbi:MAG: ISAs1 family transposase [Pseudonocardiaceae bacterium]
MSQKRRSYVLHSLLEAFREVPDPRVARTRGHPLVNVLVMSLLGAISGADGWEALELFASHRASFFRTFLSMPKGTPSADTFRRVFEVLDPVAFQDAFRRWLRPLLDDLEGKTIAMDGKTLRGALARAGNKGAFHLMHVWSTEQRLLLAQKAVEGASGEVGAAIELLEMLNLEGATVTADANSCTSEITTVVRKRGAHYVLALKGNRGALHTYVKERFAEAEQGGYKNMKVFEDFDNAHGRTEARVVRAMPMGPLPDSIKAPWADLKTIVEIGRMRVADSLTVHRAYYVTSHRADPKHLAARIRGHWSIENQLHHCLDVTFGEDRRSIRSKNAAQNFALISRYALSILKRDPTKMSVAMKRRKAAWADSYFVDVLAGGFPQL